MWDFRAVESTIKTCIGTARHCCVPATHTCTILSHDTQKRRFSIRGCALTRHVASQPRARRAVFRVHPCRRRPAVGNHLGCNYLQLAEGHLLDTVGL